MLPAGPRRNAQPADHVSGKPWHAGGPVPKPVAAAYGQGLERRSPQSRYGLAQGQSMPRPHAGTDGRSRRESFIIV